MKRISIFLYFLIVFNLVPAITYNLINSDVKILKIIDLSYRYNKLFLTNPSIQDLNSDGINDLFFTESYYMVSLNDYFRVFYGHKIWRPLIYEDECDIDVVDTMVDRGIDIDCGKIVNIPDEGKYLVLIERSINCRSYQDHFFLLPADLIPGSYNRHDVECRHYDSLEFYGSYTGVAFPINPHNYTVFDSFFVFPGVFCFPSPLVFASVWAFLPIDLSGDTVNIVENSTYQLVIRNRNAGSFSHVIFSPGDVNGDGYNELVFGKMTMTWGIGFNPTSAPIMGQWWAMIYLLDFEQSFSSHILWGRREWHGADTISYECSSYKYNTYTHSHHNNWVVGPEEECDLDNDGFADIILNEAMALISSDSTSYADPFIWTDDTLRHDFGDTSKLYILFGSRDFPRGVYDSIQNVADVTIKSRYTNAGIGGAISVGDYNGDGYDDILVGSACVAGHLGYLFLGNEYRAYPEWFEDADIFFTAESAYTYLTNPNLRYIMYNTGVRLGDLNGDGLDDVVLSIYMYKFRDSPTGRNIFPFPFVYIFFNKRPSAELVKPDSPRIDDVRDTVCFKLDYKTSLALISLNLTVDEDTFNIDSPELSFDESESLLCFVPSRDWDTSAIIRFCINRLTDMIGTEMDVPWCVNFNGTPGIIERKNLPTSTVLNVYPNPFNSVCQITAPVGSKIEIYNLQGKLVWESQSQMDHINKDGEAFSEVSTMKSFVWRPDESIGSGVYLVSANCMNIKVVKKIVYMK